MYTFFYHVKSVACVNYFFVNTRGHMFPFSFNKALQLSCLSREKVFIPCLFRVLVCLFVILLCFLIGLLNAGKYANVLRECGAEYDSPITAPLVFSMHPQEYAFLRISILIHTSIFLSLNIASTPPANTYF